MTERHRGAQNLLDLLLDFGATANIICNNDVFREANFRSETSYLKTGSGEMVMTEGKGALHISPDDGNGNFRPHPGRRSLWPTSTIRHHQRSQAR